MKMLTRFWCMLATLSISVHLSAEEQYVYFNNSQFLCLALESIFSIFHKLSVPVRVFSLEM